jgi:hypothetical protein
MMYSDKLINDQRKNSLSNVKAVLNLSTISSSTDVSIFRTPSTNHGVWGNSREYLLYRPSKVK